MKILINTSTINQGGALQVATNLIQYTLNNTEHDYYYIISKEINELKPFRLESSRTLITDKSPAKIFNSWNSRMRILKFEEKIKPDLVYSVGAPSYINFKSKEVIRLTNPTLIGADKIAYSTFKGKDLLVIYLKNIIQRFFIKKTHFVITQTQDAKRKINENLGISTQRIFVVPNTHAEIFKKINKQPKNIVNILCLAAPYPHKNLSIIPEVAYELKKLGVTNFQFLTTIPEWINNNEIKKLRRLSKNLRVEDQIKNLGRISLEECLKWYYKSDVVFLPTLLEVFSATHIEAMATGTPVVTTDLPFCREICQEGALYFAPKNEKDAAEKIHKLLTDKELYEKKIAQADQVVKSLPNPNEIYRMHIKTLEKIFNA
ncbi:Glycosyltransferase [Fulvivirga imtechensis AK7]|uniref:Glycosyltransferase n=1 Tax=Fulvivirga imtechensis AK7 TaxID=1237149 RepID=L8JUK8_9BACT|nr:glycosyltransferase [Fulvivirga imtechensis]ELR70977.1 Glycosyltransferase [Fulvivirga imtechensis AK7]